MHCSPQPYSNAGTICSDSLPGQRSSHVSTNSITTYLFSLRCSLFLVPSWVSSFHIVLRPPSNDTTKVDDIGVRSFTMPERWLGVFGFMFPVSRGFLISWVPVLTL